MATICFCKDHSGSAELRRTSAQEHLAYIESILHRILIAGPLGENGSDDFDASCFIYDTDDRDEALQLLHNDPYYKAGIYADVHCQYFLPAAGAWIGGKIW